MRFPHTVNLACHGLTSEARSTVCLILTRLGSRRITTDLGNLPLCLCVSLFLSAFIVVHLRLGFVIFVHSRSGLKISMSLSVAPLVWIAFILGSLWATHGALLRSQPGTTSSGQMHRGTTTRFGRSWDGQNSGDHDADRLPATSGRGGR